MADLISQYEKRNEIIKDNLSKKVVDITNLKKSCWGGIPNNLRPKCWRIFLKTVNLKSDDYQSSISKTCNKYKMLINEMKISKKISHQIEIDVLRIDRKNKIFNDVDYSQLFLKVLSLYAYQRPAVGYVQGMSDILIPFVYVFVQETIDNINDNANTCAKTSTRNSTDSNINDSVNNGAKVNYVIENKPKCNIGRNNNAKVSNVLDNVNAYCNTETDTNSKKRIDQVIGNANFIDRVSNTSSFTNINNGKRVDEVFDDANINGCVCDVSDHSHISSGDANHNSLLLESSVYFCFSRFIDRLQDNYIDFQNGIINNMEKMKCILEILEPDLMKHMNKIGFELHMFAFKWFNCFFTREFDLDNVLVIFDTLFSSQNENYALFARYFAVTLLVSHKNMIMKNDLSANLLYIQSIDQIKMSLKDVQILLSSAYVNQSIFNE